MQTIGLKGAGDGRPFCFILNIRFGSEANKLFVIKIASLNYNMCGQSGIGDRSECGSAPLMQILFLVHLRLIRRGCLTQAAFHVWLKKELHAKQFYINSTNVKQYVLLFIYQTSRINNIVNCFRSLLNSCFIFHSPLELELCMK